MAPFDDASQRLRHGAAALQTDLQAALGEVRRALESGNGGAARATMEFEAVLRRLDALNEAAGECLAALEDA